MFPAALFPRALFPSAYFARAGMAVIVPLAVEETLRAILVRLDRLEQR
jgi:hypothetical protein